MGQDQESFLGIFFPGQLQAVEPSLELWLHWSNDRIMTDYVQSKGLYYFLPVRELHLTLAAALAGEQDLPGLQLKQHEITHHVQHGPSKTFCTLNNPLSGSSFSNSFSMKTIVTIFLMDVTYLSTPRKFMHIAKQKTPHWPMPTYYAYFVKVKIQRFFFLSFSLFNYANVLVRIKRNVTKIDEI